MMRLQKKYGRKDPWANFFGYVRCFVLLRSLLQKRNQYHAVFWSLGLITQPVFALVWWYRITGRARGSHKARSAAFFALLSILFFNIPHLVSLIKTTIFKSEKMIKEWKGELDGFGDLLWPRNWLNKVETTGFVGLMVLDLLRYVKAARNLKIRSRK